MFEAWDSCSYADPAFGRDETVILHDSCDLYFFDPDLSVVGFIRHGNSVLTGTPGFLLEIRPRLVGDGRFIPVSPEMSFDKIRMPGDYRPPPMPASFPERSFFR